MSEQKKMKIDHVIFWPPLLLISVICGLIIKDPKTANDISNKALSWTTDKLGWAFEWYVVILFVIAMYLIFGKYKDKKFGEGKPEFKTSTWLGMMFSSTSSAITSSMLSPVIFRNSIIFLSPLLRQATSTHDLKHSKYHFHNSQNRVHRIFTNANSFSPFDF